MTWTLAFVIFAIVINVIAKILEAYVNSLEDD